MSAVLMCTLRAANTSSEPCLRHRNSPSITKPLTLPNLQQPSPKGFGNVPRTSCECMGAA
jgi:hypothetical protein